MTGAFTVKGEKRHKFVKFKVSEDWPPRFAKLELQVRASKRDRRRDEARLFTVFEYLPFPSHCCHRRQTQHDELDMPASSNSHLSGARGGVLL